MVARNGNSADINGSAGSDNIGSNAIDVTMAVPTNIMVLVKKALVVLVIGLVVRVDIYATRLVLLCYPT